MRARQTGSIVGFVIVGALLAALLIGGTYIVRRILAPTGSTIQPPSQNESGSEDDSPDQASDDDNSTTGTDEKPASEGAVLPGDTNSQNQPVPNNEGPAHDLPQTGPVSSVLSGIFLSGIVAAGAIYKRSRDHLASL